MNAATQRIPDHHPRFIHILTDMDEATFFSCLINHKRFTHVFDHGPVEKRMAIIRFDDSDDNPVAYQIHDTADEYGRYQRIRRLLVVPDGPVAGDAGDDDLRLSIPCSVMETTPVHVVHDTELDRHSALWRVIQCLLDECRELSSNEYIYADDAAGTNVHIEEVEIIINHLKHGRAPCAIQISDCFGDDS